jgi:hypothetical protein
MQPFFEALGATDWEQGPDADMCMTLDIGYVCVFGLPEKKNRSLTAGHA